MSGRSSCCSSPRSTGCSARTECGLETTDKAIDWLADKGYDPLFGARPIKRTLQKYLVNELSKEILQGTVTRDTVIHVDANKDGLVFKN